MSPAVTIESPPSLAGNQRAALISLLADDDGAVYQMVRGRLLAYGPVVCEWLRPQLLSADPVLRRRAQEIVTHFGRQHSDETFLAFCLNNGEDLNLEEGAWLLAQTRYPDINREAYRALLDHYAGELQRRIDFSADGPAILGIINQFFFNDLGFGGNELYGSDPENCYVNRIVDRRTGNPIGLCALYLLVARRLRLPVTGIGLPGHFVCRYQSTTREIYIDAFNRGKFLTKADCIKYLLRTNHGLQEGYLAPVTPRRILLRMCANLNQTYLQLERLDEAARLKRYLVALAN